MFFFSFQHKNTILQCCLFCGLCETNVALLIWILAYSFSRDTVLDVCDQYCSTINIIITPDPPLAVKNNQFYNTPLNKKNMFTVFAINIYWIVWLNVKKRSSFRWRDVLLETTTQEGDCDRTSTLPFWLLLNLCYVVDGCTSECWRWNSGGMTMYVWV